MADSSKNKSTTVGNYSDDDSQLTIKIPNPKVYMARQSLWVGHRGKPRCDHCRLNNLKCDRMLPSCNHCSWASGRVCKYTPLPTPAHRGIPRCDSCRLGNLKCDRTLPICNHCKEGNKGECVYTPKKRRKPASETAPVPKKSIEPSEPLAGSPFEFSKAKGPEPASTTHDRAESPSSASDSLDEPPLRQLHTGRFAADFTMRSGPSSTLPLIAPKHSETGNTQRSYPTRGVIPPSFIAPWIHATIAPLPEFINHGLRLINSVDMPTAATFNESLKKFLDDTMDELRETSCLPADTYVTASRCLSTGDTSKLTPRLREWITLHHLCSGSGKFDLILVPQDSMFQSGEASQESYRRAYSAQIDGGIGQEVRVGPIGGDNTHAEHFHRLPAREQIFDLLTYAHVSHSDPFTMLMAIKDWGFALVTWPMAELYVRLCPVCNLRNPHPEVPCNS